MVGNAETALERLSMQTFDAVFMDVHLPGIDGIGSTRIIRGWASEANAFKQIAAAFPILGVPATESEATLEVCHASGDGWRAHQALPDG